MDSVIELVQNNLYKTIRAAAEASTSPITFNNVTTGVRPQASIGNDIVLMGKSSTRAQAVGYTLHTFDMSVLCFSDRPDTAAQAGDYISEYIATAPANLSGFFARTTQSTVFYTDQDDYVCDLQVEVKFVDRTTALGGFGGNTQNTEVWPLGGGGDGNQVTIEEGEPTFLSFTPPPNTDVLADADVDDVSESQSTTQSFNSLSILGPNGELLPDAEITSATIRWYAKAGTGYTLGIVQMPGLVINPNSFTLDFTNITLNSDNSLEWNTNGPIPWSDLDRFNIQVKMSNNVNGVDVNGIFPLNATVIP